MRVCYVQSGGFVGAIKSCEVNMADLEPPLAEQVQLLMAERGLQKTSDTVTEHVRDQKQYEITIEDDTNAVCISFDEHNIPEEAKTLLSYLQKHAKPGKL